MKVTDSGVRERVKNSSKIRKPNVEIRRKSEVLNQKIGTRLGFLAFAFRACFEFRISHNISAVLLFRAVIDFLDDEEEKQYADDEIHPEKSQKREQAVSR